MKSSILQVFPLGGTPEHTPPKSGSPLAGHRLSLAELNMNDYPDLFVFPEAVHEGRRRT